MLALQNLISVALTLAGLGGLLALLHLQERAVGRYLAHNLGWRSVLVTGWFGVPVHELGHLIFAGLFGHRIVSWRLFDPDPVTGTLGYVRHAHDRRNVWQVLGNVFVAGGPLVTGGLVLWGLARWMLPPESLSAIWRSTVSLDLAQHQLQQLWQLGVLACGELWRHRSPWSPLQLYLAICVASHLCPSRADLAGAWKGSALLLSLLAAAAGLAGWLGVSTEGAAALLLPLLLLAVAAGAFQGLYVAVVALLLSLTSR